MSAWTCDRCGKGFDDCYCGLIAGKETLMHTEIILLANGYMEVVCIDPWLEGIKRHWLIRRTVDYSRICLQ
jgi:hypothetical protein